MGHLINPISFRLGRSIFWTNNFNYINNNYRLLKKKNFLFKFVFKVLNWFFHEKFSLNFFYYRHRIYRKVSYVKYLNNLNNLFINKYFFLNNFLKLFKKLFKKKIIFYFYRRNYVVDFNNLNTQFKLNYSKIKYYFIISNYFLKNYLSIQNISEIGFDMFFWFSKQATLAKKISKIKIPKFVKLFKILTILRIKNYLNNFISSHSFKFFNYFYNLIFLNKKKKKFLYLYKSLLYRIKFFKYYIARTDRIQYRVKRPILRFFKLEVIDIQLFLISNKIKINILVLKEKVLKFFYQQKMRQLFYFLKIKIKFKKKKLKILLKKLNNLIQIFINLNILLSFNSNIKILKFIFLYLVRYLKKIIKKYINRIYIKKYNIINLFKTNIIYFFKLKNRNFLIIKNFNRSLLNTINLYLFERLLKNIFFNYNIKIKFILLHNTLLNALIIFKFIHAQLSLRKPIPLIMKIVCKEIFRYKKFKGFKILLRGRFTRKERAFNRIWYYGKVPLSTIVKPVDYYSHFFISKFGVGSIRIWLYRG